jgi:hypothetical protein
MALDLTGAVQAPPRSTRGASQTAKRESVKVSGKLAARHEAATGIAQLVGFGCIVTRQYADAGAIGMHSPPIIDELVALSDKNEKIGKALDYLTEAGPYAGLIVAVMPLALQIMANHGLVKAELISGAGVVPPVALESQVRADMARQAAEALKAQQTAEAELAQIAAQMRQENPPDVPPGPPTGNGRARSQAKT